MKVRFYRWYNVVLTTLLTMLGYGCTKEEPMDMYGVMVEYGVPSANYIVKGTVTDEGGTPIQGIKTSVKSIPDEAPQYTQGLDSVQTDNAGKFQLKASWYAGIPDLKLIVEDVDGEANGGEFLSDTIRIDELKRQKLEDGDGWYEGKFELNADVKLKKK